MKQQIFRLMACGSILALMMTACSPAAPTDAPISPGHHTIAGVAVVDVEQGVILPDQMVIIEDGLIQAVGPHAEISAPKGSHVIDGRGLYLMPGLVDAHVHYFDAPVFGRVMIANGVLLVRDMGQPTEQVLKLRDALNRGEMLGPEMIATGSILDGDPPLIPSISLGLGTPEAGRNAVRQQAQAGVDEIKVYSRLNKDVFLAIVDEAQQVGLKVVGHVPDSITIEDAAAAGLKSSEHVFGFEKIIVKLLGGHARQTYAGMGSETGYLQRLGEVNPEDLRGVYHRLRARGLTVCPTVVTFQVGTNYRAILAGEYPVSDYVSPGILDLWKSQWSGQDDLPDFIWQKWAQMVSEMNQAGVSLMVGTDLVAPGIIPGYAVHQEMAIWQEAGIPAADVLRSATLVPARFMGLDDRVGTVAQGKTASLVLVKADPLKDIRNAQMIEAVFLRGQYYSRDDLNRLLSEARELARPQSVSSDTLAASTATSVPPTATSCPAIATAVANTPAPTARPTAPTATPNPDWVEYRNELFGYRLSLPEQASVEELGPEYFPPDELPAGADSNVYLEQLQERYRGICVRVEYGLGYVYVSAPLNSEARYSPCGRTGVGEVDIVTRTLTLPIDGALYETTEMEFISSLGETLADHSNYLMVRLDDGSRIEIGSVPGAASWQEYVASTRDVLLRIVSSYQSLTGVTPGPTLQDQSRSF